MTLTHIVQFAVSDYDYAVTLVRVRGKRALVRDTRGLESWVPANCLAPIEGVIALKRPEPVRDYDITDYLSSRRLP